MLSVPYSKVTEESVVLDGFWRDSSNLQFHSRSLIPLENGLWKLVRLCLGNEITKGTSGFPRLYSTFLWFSRSSGHPLSPLSSSSLQTQASYSTSTKSKLLLPKKVEWKENQCFWLCQSPTWNLLKLQLKLYLLNSTWGPYVLSFFPAFLTIQLQPS